jgi:hypothetical protein
MTDGTQGELFDLCDTHGGKDGRKYLVLVDIRPSGSLRYYRFEPVETDSRGTPMGTLRQLDDLVHPDWPSRY